MVMVLVGMDWIGLNWVGMDWRYTRMLEIFHCVLYIYTEGGWVVGVGGMFDDDEM